MRSNSVAQHFGASGPIPSEATRADNHGSVLLRFVHLPDAGRSRLHPGVALRPQARRFRVRSMVFSGSRCAAACNLWITA
jgi:hypothetical protein